MGDVKCGFSTVNERDMDLLFLQTVATDHEFAQMVVNKVTVDNTEKYKGKNFLIESVELSNSDADLGESDITVVVNFEGTRVGFLIEDKIDAPAQPQQYERYVKRGEKGVRKGLYDSFEIFIFCPEKYHEVNKEAIKYWHWLSYEDCRKYFDEHDSAINRIRSLQVSQAIQKSKRTQEVIQNEAAIAFNAEYHEYQKRHYPKLDLATSASSNGWWEHYRTNYGKVYMYHKTSEGHVELLFPDASKTKMDRIARMAEWLRKHSDFHVTAEKAGKSGALRIEVPKIDMKGKFADVTKDDLNKCFDALQELSDFADVLENARQASLGDK